MDFSSGGRSSHYDPEIGRWTLKDPILFKGRMTNLYGYSFIDPVNYIDTDGKCPLCVAVIGGAFVGAAANVLGAAMSHNLSYDNFVQTAATGAIGGAVAVAESGAAITAASVTSLNALPAVDVGSTAVASIGAGLVTDLGLNILFNSPPSGISIQDMQNLTRKPHCP